MRLTIERLCNLNEVVTCLYELFDAYKVDALSYPPKASSLTLLNIHSDVPRWEIIFHFIRGIVLPSRTISTSELPIMSQNSLQSLAAAVEQIWEVHPDPPDGYTRSGLNWYHALCMVDQQQPDYDESRSIALSSALSQVQHSSLRLLREWWEGTIQDSPFPREHRNLSTNTAMESFVRISRIGLVPANAQDAQEAFGGIPIPWIGGSSYHKALRILWLSEFSIIPTQQDYSLPSTRYWASIAATNQRIVLHCFMRTPEGSLISQRDIRQGEWLHPRPTQTSLSICPWLESEPKQSSTDGESEDWPHFLWDIQDQRTVEARKLPRHATYTVISHTWGRWQDRKRPRATIPGVPWKIPFNSRFDVLDLPRMLKETASFTTPYLWLDLLCIPQIQEPCCKLRGHLKLREIAESEISRQGKIFKNAKCAMAWLNYVSEWSGLEHAISWFAARFDQISATSSQRQTPNHDADLQLLEQIANSSRCGLLCEEEDESARRENDTRPFAWFSSLWTLQEACLRPDMLLVDQHWNVFTVGPSALPLTLDNLIAVVAGFEQHSYRIDPVIVTKEDLQNLHGLDPLPGQDTLVLPNMPLAAKELHSIMQRFELTQLLDAKLLTILALANQRYSRDSRAQAIMSVVGATRWYEGRAETCSPSREEQDLVLGTFPLAFIQEVRMKLGAGFFRSTGSGKEVCRNVVFSNHADPLQRTVSPVGSMMPFSARTSQDQRRSEIPEGTDYPQPRAASISPFSAGAHDDPSVQTWDIMQDGTVRMSKVSVFASYIPGVVTYDAGSGLRARVTAHCCTEGTTVKDVVLAEFLENYNRSQGYKLECCLYALLLSHGTFSRQISGILVQEVLESRWFEAASLIDHLENIIDYERPTRLLVRIGSWRLWDLAKIAEEDIPRMREVNWRVL